MNRINLSKSDAEIILRRWLGRKVRCIALCPLTGGCVNTVIEAHFEHSLSPAVIKIAQGPGFGEGEYAILDFYRKNTSFPVPEPYFYDSSASELQYSYLIMQRVPGENMGSASRWMNSHDRLRVERQIAEAVAELHTHTRERFGGCREKGTDQPWGERFQQSVLSEYRRAEATGLLSSKTQTRILRLIEQIPRALEAPARPTLVHGDIWATNIMIDRSRQGAVLSGFLDTRGIYAHPEFELAYLEIWHTVGPTFFEIYTHTHPLMEGYEVRRLFYWLNTLLIHVHYFK
ncbi:MAG: fructosamine kinase family protein, partial [Candidatus Latescibacteria bacterium]|nr:fructosamine kinase family protein [Candidatus Latescibacterota bacterium]